jgi:hypothetical protein
MMGVDQPPCKLSCRALLTMANIVFLISWERDMTIGDINIVYVYKRDMLPHLYKQTRSYDSAASNAIKDCFLAYGWSFPDLLHSETKVMAILIPYLQQKRSYDSGWSEDSGSADKRQRVNRPEAFTSYPDHKTVESIPRSNSSHLISFDTINRARDLTDTRTMNNLSYAFNSSDELTDTATVSILGHTVNDPDEVTDPPTARNFGYTINSSDEITDLDIPDFLSQPNYEVNSAAAFLEWSVNGSGALTDASTDSFLQRATSPNQLYRMVFVY